MRYKRRELMQYTETVYYEDGNEVARIRNFDDHWYDSEAEEDVTEDEITDFYEGSNA